MLHPSQMLKIRHADAAAVFPLGGKATLASVTVSAVDGAWGTAVLTPKWANAQGGPWFTFAAGELSDATMGPGDDSTAWINVQGKGFLAVVVTTAEGAEDFVTVAVCDDA